MLFIQLVQGATSPQIERVSGLPQINVEYDRTRMANYGLNIQEVNSAVSTAFAGQAAVWAGLYFLLDKLSKRWEGKAFFTLMQTNALWKGMVACFVLIFPLLLLGFFVGWTHLRINNWLWIAFYSGALLVLSCRRWWVRLLGVGLNLLSLWALTLIVSMGSGQTWLELLWRSILPFLPVTIL